MIYCHAGVIFFPEVVQFGGKQRGRNITIFIS
uniref:Uncharacterized protein n=1 Tax=Anguilla anguilla TaxID=7936 RepID=A0A0E9SDA5_ANGAN